MKCTPEKRVLAAPLRGTQTVVSNLKTGSYGTFTEFSDPPEPRFALANQT